MSKAILHGPSYSNFCLNIVSTQVTDTDISNAVSKEKEDNADKSTAAAEAMDSEPATYAVALGAAAAGEEAAEVTTLIVAEDGTAAAAADPAAICVVQNQADHRWDCVSKVTLYQKKYLL